MDFLLILLTYVGWLAAIRFLVARGLGTFSSVTRDLSGFMLGKALGPAIDLVEDREGAGAKMWFSHGIMWFIIAGTLAFVELWTSHEPNALAALGAIAYAPSAEQTTAAVHIAAAFGALSMLFIGAGLSIQARLSGGRMASEANAGLMAWAWSAVVAVGVILSHTDLVGTTNWFELPPIYYLLFTLIALPLFINHLLTMSGSDSPNMVSQWFIVLGFASLLWTGVAAATLMAGDNELLAWLLVKILFGGWLTANALAIAHYVVPNVVGRPLWSQTLAGVALVGTFLTFSPLGAGVAISQSSLTIVNADTGATSLSYLQGFAAIFLTLSLLPLIATVANLVATTRGRPSESIALSFTMFGVILLVPISLGSLFASVSAFGGGSELAHISTSLDSLAIWGAFGMIALGGVNALFPEVCGRQLFSTTKSRLTFWLYIVGILGFGIGNLIAQQIDAAVATLEASASQVATEVAELDGITDGAETDLIAAIGFDSAIAHQVKVFASIMFYLCTISGILLAQNMLQGAFRGAVISDEVATETTATSPERMAVTGTTSVRRLLSAGAGLDTSISFTEGGDSAQPIALSDLQESNDE